MYTVNAINKVNLKGLSIIKTIEDNKVIGTTSDKEGNKYILIVADNDFFYEQAMKEVSNAIAGLLR